MRDILKKDILEVLEQVLASLQAEDHHALSELSNHVIHDASIFQDDDSVSFAVVIYALSKIVQRCCDEKIPVPQVASLLQEAKDALELGKEDVYRTVVKRIFEEVKKLDEKISLYITEVINQARIKKASKMSEHGISLARTAELLGISQWELQDYFGKTQIPEHELGVPVKHRLKLARSWFQ
jgi:AraC-like DNA-binding protein